MHLTTIDSEFNNKYQPLSIGIVKSKLFNINYIHESFYKASVDFGSYRIHGLSESFLRKFGKEQFEARKLVNALCDTVLVGFSIENDIRAIKIPRHYKLIDLHDIFKSFGLSISLEKFGIKTGIINKFKNFMPLHTALMDSFLTFAILEHLVFFLRREGFSTTEVLNDLIDITKNFKSKENSDEYHKKYESLKDLLKELKDVPIEVNKCKDIYIKLKNNTFDVLDSECNIIARYKKNEYQYFRDKNKRKVEFIKCHKKEYNMGFKHLIF